MPAYFFVDVREITDAPKMEEYRKRIVDNVEKFGGRYVAVGGPFEVVEGAWRPVYPVLIEFPDLTAAKRWYNSEEYRELKALRLAAANCDAVFIEGRSAKR